MKYTFSPKQTLAEKRISFMEWWQEADLPGKPGAWTEVSPGPCDVILEVRKPMSAQMHLHQVSTFPVSTETQTTIAELSEALEPRHFIPLRREILRIIVRPVYNGYALVLQLQSVSVPVNKALKRLSGVLELNTSFTAMVSVSSSPVVPVDLSPGPVNAKFSHKRHWGKLPLRALDAEAPEVHAPAFLPHQKHLPLRVTRAIAKIIAEHASIHSKHTVLAGGCGNCHLAAELANHFPKVVCVDKGRDAKESFQLNKKPKMEFWPLDLEKPGFYQKAGELNSSALLLQMQTMLPVKTMKELARQNLSGIFRVFESFSLMSRELRKWRNLGYLTHKVWPIVVEGWSEPVLVARLKPDVHKALHSPRKQRNTYKKSQNTPELRFSQKKSR